MTSNFQHYNGLWIGESPISMPCCEVSLACFLQAMQKVMSQYGYGMCEVIYFYIADETLFVDLLSARSSLESVAHSLCAYLKSIYSRVR